MVFLCLTNYFIMFFRRMDDLRHAKFTVVAKEYQV